MIAFTDSKNRSLSNPWRLGALGANPIWAGEESRAKDAKDAKVKGMEDDEIAGVVVGVEV